MSSTESREENIIRVDLNGMKVDPSTELPIFRPDEDFKTSLLANLYSTVEFLKNELQEKNSIINKLLLHAENLCLRTLEWVRHISHSFSF